MTQLDTIQSMVSEVLDLMKAGKKPQTTRNPHISIPLDLSESTQSTIIEELKKKNTSQALQIINLKRQLLERQKALNEVVARTHNEVRLVYDNAYPITVKFADGTIISEVTGTATYIRAIRKLGPTRCREVSKYFRNKPTSRAWYYDEVEGWAIRTMLTYEEMKTRLLEFAAKLNTSITVEICSKVCK